MATHTATTLDLRPALARRTGRFPCLNNVSPRLRPFVLDAVAVVVAVLDVWLVIPEKAQPYSVVLSALACAAMLMRRRYPFLATLATVPGFLAGWAQLAAMIALGTLARRRQWAAPTMIGAGLVWLCRYVQWPLADFVSQNWREHVLNGMYGVLVAGMPVALGSLVALRAALSDRIRELAASRERERRLHEEAIRTAERTKLAREMHDVVSHQVTLIAMQAGALVVSTEDEHSRRTAQTIRQLSTRTLDELRDLIGVLRSASADDTRPGLEALDDLMHSFTERIDLAVRDIPERLPAPVSRAAYRTVQEALTNVHKHAGGANTVIRVRTEGGSLVVEIRNESVGPPRPTPTSPGALPSGGHGLIGLRERAGLLDGTFEAGHTIDGGFLVRARYPLGVRTGTEGVATP